MQLKKLEIQGFKSFADKTEIVFLDGITTIVGPNGSGKSNISDAIRWVIGEQSVKNLRGLKMEDVIFAGTQLRKKVGFAEVSMYLDNSDATLPVEYSEVVITRRVYRSGESNYLINSTECRLKDIQELFMDTGIGKDGYSIISQGKIDEILSSKSEERRHIFEEAAGIVKYRSRKEEAQKKLDNTQITLSRVTDILKEIENTIEPLEKRAIVAKKYLNLRDELKILDIRIFIHSLEQNALNLSNLDDIVETFLKDIENEDKTSLQLNRDKLNIKEKIEELSLRIEEAQKKYFEIENDAEKLNSHVHVLESDISNDNSNLVRLKIEIDEDSEKIKLLMEEIQKRHSKNMSLSQNKKKFEFELKDKQLSLNEIIKTLDTKGLEIENLKLDIDTANEIKYEYKSNISSMIATCQANEKQLLEKERSEVESISQKDSVNATKDDVYMQLCAKNKELKVLQIDSDKCVEKLKNNEQDLNVVNEKYSKVKQDVMTLKSKLNYLINLDNENEGYHKSVKASLDFSKNNMSVYGTVASIISTDLKYETAIEIALGGFLQNIIVEDENHAKDIIEYLKNNTLGRATFLPLSSIKKVKNENKKLDFLGVIAYACDLVKFDKKYTSVIELSLANTVIVDTLQNGIQIAKQTKNMYKIVTLAGELIAQTGSITGGQVSHKSAGLLGRQEKIQDLQIQIECEEKTQKEFSQLLQSTQKNIEEVKRDLSNIKDKKDILSIEVATLSEKFENLKREIEKIENMNKNSVKLISQLKTKNIELNSEVLRLQEDIENSDKIILSKQAIIDEYSRFNKERQKEIDNLNEDIVNLKISISSFDESVMSNTEMKEKIEQDINNFNSTINRKKEQINTLNVNVENSKIEIDKIVFQISNQSSIKFQYQELVEKLKVDKTDFSNRQDELELKMLESVKKIERLKDEKSKVETKKLKFELDIQNLKNKMWDEYEMTVSSAKQILGGLAVIELSEKEINKQAENIRKEIKELGEVNIASIDEFKTMKERYDFILSQKLDLDQTKEKLQNLINNMLTIMKTQFSKQFKLITQNFNETFMELFGGGKALLKLSDESNVLDSGIEIEVQPSGKKLQNMMLLSGGERALTATALLFAIIKLKSPPFCILDEIEAALDDVNVTRFADYIKKYSNNTQFIVITHRKGTMEVASSVYGVTMQEYGISKVISMKMK
ncbi:MAG: chromosome segregation protein SMC [Clostridia bacterium]